MSSSLNKWGQNRWRTGLLAAGAGALTAFGFAPYDFWPLALAGWAVLPALIWQSGSAWRAAGCGWAFAVGFFAHALSWIVEPFLVDPVRHGWMAPFALVLMAGGLALFWGSAFGLAYRLGRSPVWRVAFLLPCLGLAEFARAYILTGFPWAAPAQAFVASPAIALLPWIGPQGLGLLAMSAALGVGLVPFLSARRLLALMPMGLLVVTTAVSLAARPQVQMTAHTIRVVQPNAPQHQKWDPDWIPVYFERHLEFTAAAKPPDLVVWPESAIAPVYERAQPQFAQIAQAARGAQVALGLRRYDQGRFFNAMARIDETGSPAGLYDKHHLVPFGEYIPLGGFAKRFGIYGLAAEDGGGYSAGPGAAVVDFGPLGQALPLICYEAVFPQDLNASPVRADFLLQLTNDAWFGAWSGPYQHLAQAQMRAAEQGLPMLRAANTGVSAIIDPNGRILAQLALGEAGFVDAALPAPFAAPFYAKTGDKPVLAFILLLFFFLLWRQRHAFHFSIDHKITDD